MNIQSIAVFCGSKPGKNPIFSKHASELGRLIALLGLKMVYGGGSSGLMGLVADAVLAHEGSVMGIIPEMLVQKERQHKGLTELAIVPDMHTRKKMMYERSDAVVILPGGLGTLDELAEVVTWNQLKIHEKSIYLLNSDGYYNFLHRYLKLMEKEGFLHGAVEDWLFFCDTPVEIFNRIGEPSSGDRTAR